MDAPGLLEVRELSVEIRPGGTILSEISLLVPPASVVGLFGESGCGKTTLAMAIPGLLDPAAYTVRGGIRLNGRELLGLPERELERIRGAQIAMVFQDPLLSLNPVLRAGRQVAEAIRAHRRPAPDEVEGFLAMAGLPDTARIREAFPHQLSGGERQRVALALALAGRPSLIIADEPFSALDVTLTVELTALFRRLKDATRTSFLLISHDPGVLARTADRVYVMRGGRIVTCGPPGQVLREAAHG